MTAKDEQGEGNGGTRKDGDRRRWLRAAVLGALLAKAAVLGVWAQGALASGSRPASATTAPAAVAPAGRSGGAASGADVRELLGAVERRQAELEARARELDQRAERLAVLEQDVTAKIAALEAVEKRLAGEAKTRQASDEEAATSLAKIYGAMKPAEAAPILDQLDDATVLTIFTRMKEKQIGEILPLMSRQRAIVLTQAIALQR
jgi:flagellar motility protein MotE (MotC chaperone)